MYTPTFTLTAVDGSYKSIKPQTRNAFHVTDHYFPPSNTGREVTVAANTYSIDRLLREVPIGREQDLRRWLEHFAHGCPADHIVDTIGAWVKDGPEEAARRLKATQEAAEACILAQATLARMNELEDMPTAEEVELA